MATSEQNPAAVEVRSSFSAHGFGLRAQKKLLSKLASNKLVLKVFIDEESGRALDSVLRLCKEYTGSKRDAERVVKNVIKIIVKLSILYRNERFDQADLIAAEAFKKTFRRAMMTVSAFYEVEFTFDKLFLSRLLLECAALLQQLVDRHLTEKSKGRIELVFNFFSDPAFLEALFAPGGPLRATLSSVVNSLNQLLERGVI